jgi:alkanesulfonate monooxygenase SsuD/methylene tetrahydromethanopterin reductase-like flavin-dependent oxidoreductase (luciferase family)
LNYPLPIQRPWPKITIGGVGDMMMKVVARHADRWNSSGSVDFMKERLHILKQNCSSIGRNYNEIEKSYWGLVSVRKNREEAVSRAKLMPTSSTWDNFVKRNAVGRPEDVADFLNLYVDEGIDEFFVYIEDSLHVETMRLFADEVIPRLG